MRLPLIWLVPRPGVSRSDLATSPLSREQVKTPLKLSPYLVFILSQKLKEE